MKFSTTGKFSLLAIAVLTSSVMRVAAADLTWTNVAGGNRLWSNAANWTNNAAPTATDSVNFKNQIGVTNAPGLVNNIVAANIMVGTTLYSALAPGYHTTLINPGVTLLVSNSFPSTGFPFSYRGALSDSSKTGYVTIKGEAMVVGNTNSPHPALTNRLEIYASATSSGVDGAFMATLDMSGLNYFACAPGEIKVGASGVTQGTRGKWILAKTNLLMAGVVTNTASATPTYGIIIGSATGGDFQPGGSKGEMQLGQENIIRANSVKIGGARAQLGTLKFQSGLINPTLTIRNVDGVSPANDLGIGDNYRTGPLAEIISTVDTATGVVDLSGGKVDILLKYLFLGRPIKSSSVTGNGSANGTLTWTDGTISCSIEANIGVQDVNTQGNATGVYNVRSNAVLLVQDLYIGRDAARASDAINGSGTGSGILNIVYGGQVIVTNLITEDYSSSTNGGSSAINLTNGTLTTLSALVTVDTVRFNNGTVIAGGYNSTNFLNAPNLLVQPGGANINNGGYAIANSSALRHDPVLGATPDGGLNSSGPGSFALNGINTYTGPTVVAAGTLRVNGSLAGGAVTAQSGATLGGSGVINGAVTIQSGGTLSPGNPLGTLTITSNLVLSANSTSVFEVDPDTLNHDTVVGLNSVTFGGTLVVNTLGGGPAITNGAAIQLFNAGNYGGAFAAIVPSAPALGLAWDVSQLTVNGTLKVVAMPPPDMSAHMNGNAVELSWPAAYTGWWLESQTNSVSAGLSTNWHPMTDSFVTNWLSLPIDRTQATVFYRLVLPPNNFSTALAMPVTLPWERTLPGAITNYALLKFTGNNNAEYFLQTNQLTQAGYQYLETAGRSSKHFHPCWMLYNTNTTNGIAVSLAYSGNWRLEITSDNGNTRIRLTTSPDNLPVFDTLGGVPIPGALVARFAGDWDNGAQPIVRYIRANLLRDLGPSWPPVQYNTWYAVNDKIDETSLLASVAAAADVGCELFTIDAGWYGGNFGTSLKWTNLRGEWTENTARFPSGLAALITEVRNRGMKFGLWVEIETVGLTMPVATNHPDWLLPGNTVLDFGNPDALAWAKAELDRMVTTYQLDYIKMDYNNNITLNTEASPGGADRVFRHYQGLGELWKHLRQQYPNLIVENCSSGSLREDVMSAALTDTHWVSDKVDNNWNSPMNFGVTYLFPPEICSHWTCYPTNASTALDMPARFTANMMGHLGLSGKITEWDAATRAVAAERIALYKQIRPVLRKADVYHLTPQASASSPQTMQAALYVQAAANKALLFAFQGNDPSLNHVLRLRGLESARNYRVTFPNGWGPQQILSGQQLMVNGLPLNFPNLGASAIVQFEPVTP